MRCWAAQNIHSNVCADAARSTTAHRRRSSRQTISLSDNALRSPLRSARRSDPRMSQVAASPPFRLRGLDDHQHLTVPDKPNKGTASSSSSSNSSGVHSADPSGGPSASQSQHAAALARRRHSLSRVRASRLRFWNANSPNFRFFILGLATLVPFGGHVIKYSVSSLQTEMLTDEAFGLDHTKLGMFQSAVSIPNLFMPLVGGLFLDHRGSAQGTMVCLALCLLGHLGFVIACIYRSFAWALVSRIVFGLGQGSTVVAQGRIIATWFVGREIIFAVALSESTHNLSNWIAFIYVVPVSEALGGYIYALWFGLGFCVLSFVAGAVFFSVNHEAEPNSKQIKRSRSQQRQIASPEAILAAEEDALIAGASDSATAYNTFADENDAAAAAAAAAAEEEEEEEEAAEDVNASPVSSPTSSIPSSSDNDDVSPFDAPPSTRTLNPLAGLSIGFAILCLLHSLYSNCFHLFAYVAPTLIEDRFHTGVAKAGWLAGLSNGLAIFLCPLAGLAMDWVGYKMWIQVMAGVLTTIAYLMLLAATVSPVPSLVLLAICVSFTPTILKSSVPNLVLPAVYGCAYGIYEIMESLGSVIGNSVVGFLRDSTHNWDLDLQVFAAMGATATALTIMLIALDWGGCVGLGTGRGGHAIGGSLNASSYRSKLDQDRLKSRKDRFLKKEKKWREIEQQQREEEQTAAAIRHVEDGRAFTPTLQQQQQ